MSIKIVRDRDGLGGRWMVVGWLSASDTTLIERAFFRLKCKYILIFLDLFQFNLHNISSFGNRNGVL